MYIILLNDHWNFIQVKFIQILQKFVRILLIFTNFKKLRITQIVIYYRAIGANCVGNLKNIYNNYNF